MSTFSARRATPALLAFLATALVASGCASSGKVPTAAAPAPAKAAAMARSLPDVIAADPELSTLNGMIQRAGLAPTLAAAGPYTVFAPTNAAMAALPAKTTEALAQDPALLADWLKMHAVAGKLASGDIKVGKVKSLQGAELSMGSTAGFVSVDDALVVRADQPAANGVVHVVDRALALPKK